jgi:hypothetical protein
MRAVGFASADANARGGEFRLLKRALQAAQLLTEMGGLPISNQQSEISNS